MNRAIGSLKKGCRQSHRSAGRSHVQSELLGMLSEARYSGYVMFSSMLLVIQDLEPHSGISGTGGGQGTDQQLFLMSTKGYGQLDTFQL